MTVSKFVARKLAQELVQQNGAGESWRAIAATFPRRADGSQIVKAGTLNRIANEAGEWLPKGTEILTALGLVVARPCDDEHTARTRKIIRGMVRRTNDAVIRRKNREHDNTQD